MIAAFSIMALTLKPLLVIAIVLTAVSSVAIVSRPKPNATVQTEPTVILLISSVLTAAAIWYIYWSYPILEGLPVTPPTPIPKLELSPLGAAVFAASGGIAGVASQIGRLRNRGARYVFSAILILLDSGFFLIYLRYGLTQPLNFIDEILTAIFIIIVTGIIAGIGLILFSRDGLAFKL